MKRNVKICLSWLIVMAMMLSFAGCGDSTEKENEEIPYEIQCLNLMDGVLASKDALSKEADADFIDAQMRFALELFQNSVAESENENVLVSPLSVMLSLSMTANGAKGQTKAEMEQVLGNGITMEDMNAYLNGYVNELLSSDKIKLQIANSIWLKDTADFTANPKFLQIVADYYGADVFKAPFDDTTLADINYWVKENTDGMIEKMLDELGENSVMYLINTILFDAEWSKPYTEYAVHEKTFTNVLGEQKSVPMMYSGEYRYLEDENAIGFTKSYKGGKYKFAALLPNEDVNIYDYIAGMTSQGLKSVLDNPTWCDVNAALPKFSYDYSIEMTKLLKIMGVSAAFGDDADFGAMGSCSIEGPLHIEKVLHKSFITVDTFGTKAGAATSTGMEAEGVPMEPKIVKLDRPFVYMIIDAETNLPIFVGAVVDI